MNFRAPVTVLVMFSCNALPSVLLCAVIQKLSSIYSNLYIINLKYVTSNDVLSLSYFSVLIISERENTTTGLWTLEDLYL